MQSSKRKDCALYVSNHYWWRDICRVTGLGMENFIKGEYGVLRQKEVLQFVDKEGHRVALADFAVNLHEEREQLTQIRQSGLWAKVLT
jgi:hypothetical protein